MKSNATNVNLFSFALSVFKEDPDIDFYCNCTGALDQLIPNNCKTKMKLILELEAYAIWYSLLLNEYKESY